VVQPGWAKTHVSGHVEQVVKQASTKSDFSQERKLLLQVSDQHEKDIIRILLSPSPDWKQRWFAAVVLGKRGSKSAQNALAQAATDKLSIVRQAAIHGLSYLSDPQSMILIRQGLLDSEMMVRSEAVDAIVRRKDMASAADLKRVLDQSQKATKKHSWMRPHVVFALGALGDSRNLSVLIETLQDSDQQVAMESCRALAKISTGQGWSLPPAQRPCKEAWLDWYADYKARRP